MRSQYAAFKQQLATTDWSITTTVGGNLTLLGGESISFFIQAHNRVGLNLLSAPKTVVIPSGHKVIITVNPSAIQDGDDVFKFIISARQGSGNIVQIAEIKARQSDNETYLQLPLNIELTQSAHISTNITPDLTTGNNLLQGQFRTRNGIVYRYDSTATKGDIAATSGFWIKDDRAGFVEITTTFNAYGCNQSMATAEIAIPAEISLAKQSQPIIIWWANNVPSAISAYSASGTKLNFAISLNGELTTSTNVLYRSLFENRIQVKFLGYVEIATGALNSDYPDTNTYYPWSSQIGIVLPEDLFNGYAAAYEIIINFDNPALEGVLSQGTSFELNLIEELTASSYNPVGTLLGNVVFNHLNNLRVVPQKVLPGKAAINKYEFTYTTDSLIFGILPDTSNQKVVISADSFGLVQVKNTSLNNNEVVRAIVSTESGTQSISFWSAEIQTLNLGALGLTINLPVDSDSGFGQIREDYPDIVSGNTNATFNVPEIIIFLKRISTGVIYKFPAIVAGTSAVLVYNLSSLDSATIINPNELPSNSLDFGLFGYLPINVNVNPNSGTLPIDSYQLAIAYNYPEDNYNFTKISHSTTLGCVPELTSTLIQAINEPSYWLSAVENITTLKAINHNKLKHGAIIHVISGRLLYWFNAFSTSANDDYGVIQPTDLSVGRFEFLTQIGSTLLSDSPFATKGALLTVNSTGEEVILPPGSNNSYLVRDNSTSTGLLWRTPNFITSETLPSALLNAITGSGSQRIIGFNNLGTGLEATELLPEIVSSSSTGSCIPVTTPGDANSRKKFAVILPPTVSGIFVLTHGGTGSPYGWSSFSLSGLSDTYPEGTTIAHNSQLLFDAAEGIWKPVSVLTDLRLTGLSDVFIENTQNNFSVIWDSELNKFTLGIPDLTGIDGLGVNTTIINVPGDGFYSFTRLILSARQPGKDLRGNFIVSSINANIQSISPYPGNGFSYQFNRSSRQLLQIPTDFNNLLGGNSFCIETWFRCTELSPGGLYTLAGRSNNSQTEFTLDIFESTANVFNVRFRGFDNSNTEYFNNNLATNLTSPGLLLNTWYHVAVTRNGNEFRIFLNGVLQKTVTQNFSLRQSFTLQSAVFLCVGRLNGSAFTDNRAFVGNIEDCRLTISTPRYITNFTPPAIPIYLSPGGAKNVNNYYVAIQKALDFDDTIPLNNNDVIAYSTASNKFRPMPIGSGGEVVSISLNQITDVDLTGAQVDYVLALNNQNVWIAKQFSVGVVSINGFSGPVQITADNIPQGTQNKYLTPGAIAEELQNFNLEDLGNVASTISNNTFLKKVNGVYQGVEIPDLPVLSELIIANFGGVFTGTGTTGQIPALNSSGKLAFIDPPSGGGGVANLNDLGDVTLTNSTNNQFLRLVSGNWVNVTLTADMVNETLTRTFYSDSKVDTRVNGLTIANFGGVFTGTGTTGQMPALNSSGKLAFIDPPSGGGGVANLNDLGDVTLTNSTNNQFLRLVSGNWVNVTLTADMVNETLTRTFYSDSKVDTRVNGLTIANFGGVFTGTGTTGQMPALNSSGKLAFIDPPSGGGGVPYQTFTTITNNYTLQASDHGKIIFVTNPLVLDTLNITLPNTLPPGFQATFFMDTTLQTEVLVALTTSGSLKAKSDIFGTPNTSVYVTHISNGNWLALGALL